MARWFNLDGVCLPKYHYLVPAAERLPRAFELIEQMRYIVLHAPRQTGKTTAIKAMADELTASGRYAALHFSCERGEPAGGDYGDAQRGILEAIREGAEHSLPADLQPPPWPEVDELSLLGSALAEWARACPRPLVLFFDEIDSLQGASLVSVLRQLRDGHPKRPDGFPASVVLCGMRNLRDYRAAAGSNPDRIRSGSPFNVKESLRLGNFTAEEVRELYAQHTADTGQEFTEPAIVHVLDLTGGQPWLVNALAYEVVEHLAAPPEPITADHIGEAKERLILARATHLDSLAARLAEERVRRVIEPVLAGTYQTGSGTYNDDLQYARDLGLVAASNPVRVANPIYREVITRVLADPVEAQLQIEDARTFVLPDGRLDLPRILHEFAGFWREHGEILADGMVYHEVAPQLVLMAYLQRVVNGGGYVQREYGIGRGRIDLLIEWPYPDPDGKRQRQREAIELKVWHPDAVDPLAKGLTQLEEYLDRCGLDTGVLVIFDRRGDAAGPPSEGTRFEEATSPSGRPVTVLRA